MNEYLSPKDVCEMLPGVTEEHLRHWRKTGRGPAYSKPGGPRGRATLYLRSDVEKYVERTRVSTRDQA